MIIGATDVQNNFGKYLKLAEIEDIIVTRKGRKTAALVPYRLYLEWQDKCSMIRETVPAYSFGGMRVSYEEFLKIAAGSENRYEYIDGMIYLLAAPFYDHQKILGRLHIAFDSWFKGKKCEAILSPFDVTLYKEGEDVRPEERINVVQPDLTIICDKEKIDKKGRYKGTPSLVVEILSDSSLKKDFMKKLNLYMLSRVKEYWIVNPFKKEILIYSYKNANVDSVMMSREKETAYSCAFKGLQVMLEDIFT